MTDDQPLNQSERDELWNSLRALRAEIDEVALGQMETARQRQLAVLLARIAATELDCRARDDG